jgi:hypothetical protein
VAADPLRGRVEQGARGRQIVLALEEPEEPGAVAVRLVVQPVRDRGDPADGETVALGEEVRRVSVVEERVRPPGEAPPNVEP